MDPSGLDIAEARAAMWSNPRNATFALNRVAPEC